MIRIIFLTLTIFVFGSTHAENKCYEYELKTTTMSPGEYRQITLTNNNIRVGIYMRTTSDLTTLANEAKLIEGAIGNTNKPQSFFPKYIAHPNNNHLLNPNTRSISKQFFVFFSPITYTSDTKYCEIVHYPKTKPSNFDEPNFYQWLGSEWSGGFVDQCHGIGYDYAGKPVFSVSYNDKETEKSSKYNLVVPEHKVMQESILLFVCNKPNNAFKLTAIKRRQFN